MKVIDLFSGCGGLSQGFQQAGFTIVAAFEFWKPAFDTYSKNFSHPVFQTDLSNVEVATNQMKCLDADVIIGGPPCQDFSQAGKRIEGDRANLTKSFAQIVSLKRPRYFVMENVDRSRLSSSYADARAIYKRSGYGLTEIVLDASFCGVPQKRKRFFCIGGLGLEDNALIEIIESMKSTKPTTLRDYYGASLPFEYYYRHPRNYSRRGIFSIDEPAPTMRGVNRPVPKGYPGHPNDPVPLSKEIRALTTEERALIQTFPANFVFCGTKTDKEQMIGNAVPVKLAEFVATALATFDKNLMKESRDNFSDWLKKRHKFTDRSISDIRSRLNRLHKENITTETELINHEKFSATSKSVKSQMKRALHLYKEFCL